MSGARTLGSLTQADRGYVVTIEQKHKAVTTVTRGVLAEVRHRGGDTSGRPVTTVTLLNYDDDGQLFSTNNHMDNDLQNIRERQKFTDRSDHPIVVTNEDLRK